MAEFIRKYEGKVIVNQEKFNEFTKDIQIAQKSYYKPGKKKLGVKKLECPFCKVKTFCEIDEEYAECFQCDKVFFKGTTNQF